MLLLLLMVEPGPTVAITELVERSLTSHAALVVLTHNRWHDLLRFMKSGRPSPRLPEPLLLAEILSGRSSSHIWGGVFIEPALKIVVELCLSIVLVIATTTTAAASSHVTKIVVGNVRLLLLLLMMWAVSTTRPPSIHQRRRLLLLLLLLL